MIKNNIPVLNNIPITFKAPFIIIHPSNDIPLKKFAKRGNKRMPIAPTMINNITIRYYLPPVNER